MAVADYVASASLLSDGSGSFTEPPYGDAFSTTTNQFTHSAGMIQRTGAGWGSFSWGTTFTADQIAGFKLGAAGECELEIRGKDVGGANWDAYSLYWNGTTGWEIYRTINGTPSAALATATQAWSVGETLWIITIGSGASVEIAAAIENGGGVGADFITYTDTDAARITTSGVPGAWANGTSFKIDEFYGGDAEAAGGGDPGVVASGPFTKMLMGVGL